MPLKTANADHSENDSKLKAKCKGTTRSTTVHQSEF